MQMQSADVQKTSTVTIGQINETVVDAARYDGEYVTASEMMSKGWTSTRISKYLGMPDRLAPNPFFRRAGKMRLYKVDRVEQAEATAEFQALQQSRRARKSHRELRAAAKDKRFQKFAEKYKGWQAALLDACNNLFNLNRYAKYESCSYEHKRDIYLLKDDLIRLLYQFGYCIECYEHVCEVRGRYEPRKVRLVAFRFLVDNKPFTWHQPEDNVRFSYVPTQPGSAWKPSDGEKEVSLSKKRFAEAKDLIDWIIPQMEKDVPPSAVEPSQTPTDSQDFDMSVWEQCDLSEDNCQKQWV
jgi:hypothetical protein